MAEYGEIARAIMRQYVGQTRVDEICREFGLSEADKNVLQELVAQWRPDYTLGSTAALCEWYRDRPHLDSIVQALEVIACEAARASVVGR